MPSASNISDCITACARTVSAYKTVPPPSSIKKIVKILPGIGFRRNVAVTDGRDGFGRNINTVKSVRFSKYENRVRRHNRSENRQTRKVSRRCVDIGKS